MVRRHEILFLYDVKDANPNGDPARENMPRYDPDTETVFVSDVRIKRTIRDCLERSGEKIFVTDKFVGDIIDEIKKEIGNDKVDRRELIQKLLEKFIDLRLFGQVIAYKKKGGKGEEDYGHIHGPVQFRFGRSLNRTKPQSHKLSSKQPRAEGDVTGKFGEKWTVPYALIATYGIVNEAVAKETNLSEDDVKKMIDCLWKGTEQLQSASKATHRPLLLVDIQWKEGEERLIGNLDDFIRIKKDEKDITWNGEHAEDGKLIRGLNDYVIDITELVKVLKKYKDSIEKIEVEANPEAEERIEGLQELRELARSKG